MTTKPILASSHFLDDNPSLRPLVTPPLSSADHGIASRFLLIPSAHSVTILAAPTGKRIATVLVDRKGSPIIECMVLSPCHDKPSKNAVDAALQSARNASNTTLEQWLLLGCRDGTVRRVRLSLDRLQTSTSSVTYCGDFLVTGTCLFPDRSWLVSDGGVCQLLVRPSSHQTHHNQSQQPQGSSEMPLYVLRRVKHRKKATRMELHRVLIPLEKNAKADLRDKTLRLAKFEGAKQNSTDADDKAVMPFVMKASLVSGKLLLVVASPKALYFYCVGVSSKNETVVKKLEFPVPKRNNHVTSLALADNSTHVAVGCLSGEILIFDHLLTLAEQYLVHDKGAHPSQAVLIRRLHWHAHPVACIDFTDNHQFLLSGGEESVLVTWQLTGGTDRPSQVLPRVALGAIRQIMEVDNCAILFCNDNSIQMVQLMDQSVTWKHQGLAVASNARGRGATAVRYDSGETLQIIGPSLAPGYMHWYNTRQMQVVKSQEIAPFNRVSRAEPGQLPIASPWITHAAFSRDGHVLVTCETVPTENTAIGRHARTKVGEVSFGMVTTLRFWSFSGTNEKSYELSATVSFPHGTTNRVSSLCVSDDGNYVCTVSNDENAFRVWHQAQAGVKDAAEGPTSTWSCLYRVSTPAGYANAPVKDLGIAFSADASILAIAYGRMLTLWDRTEMSLLKSLVHVGGNDDHAVNSVQFLDSDACGDMLMTATASSVSVQSPFGSNGPSNAGWTYEVGSSKMIITSVSYLRTKNTIILSVFYPEKLKSQVLLIDAISGANVLIADNVSGKILSVVAKEQHIFRRSTKNSLNLVLYALSDDGAILALRSTSNSESDGELAAVPDDISGLAPKIPLLGAYRERSAKARAGMTLEEIAPPSAKRLKVNDDLGEEGRSEVPEAFTINYARSFLARHLQR